MDDNKKTKAMPIYPPNSSEDSKSIAKRTGPDMAMVSHCLVKLQDAPPAEAYAVRSALNRYLLLHEARAIGVNHFGGTLHVKMLIGKLYGRLSAYASRYSGELGAWIEQAGDPKRSSCQFDFQPASERQKRCQT